MKRVMPYSLVLTVLISLAIPIGASELVVGSEGQILQLLSGRYGELFPDGSEADPEANVLAVDFIGANSSRRSLVPSTSDHASELSPTLYYDPMVDIPYVLWSSRHNGIHPFLRLVQLNDDVWSETLDITGSVFAVKNEPQLSVHHESWTSTDGNLVKRTVFHVLWWEELGDSFEERASAVVVENGTLVGSTGILTLSDFVDGEAESLGGAGSLDSSIHLLGSENGIVVGFIGRSGEIEVLASDVLPVALSRLALAVEEAILGYDSEGDRSLHEVVVDIMLEFGTEFHPATLSVMIESVLDMIDESADLSSWLGSALLDLADKVMPQIVHIGARMKSGGLEGGDVSIVTVRPDLAAASSQLHHLALRSLASFPMPDSELGVGTQLFISKRGTAALVAWDDGDYVAYRETTADGAWTEMNFLDLTKGIDRDTAYRILEERTLER